MGQVNEKGHYDKMKFHTMSFQMTRNRYFTIALYKQNAEIWASISVIF